MSNFFTAYQSLFDQMILAAMFALSQFIVLRAGVFSVATAGLGSIGAYTAAILALHYGWTPWLGIGAASLAGAAVSLVLAIPLARLRGIFQAVATLAFVQIVISLVLQGKDLTGGAVGLNGIPKVVDTWQLVVLLAVLVYLLAAMSSTSIGRAFNVVRQDETVALSLGISVVRHHALAFALSGAIAGLAGGLYAFHSYSLVPGQFDFTMLVATLTAVVLGGSRTVLGPIVGAAFLTVLPEISREFAAQRYLLQGAMLVVISIYLPNGITNAPAQMIASLRRKRVPRRRPLELKP